MPMPSVPPRHRRDQHIQLRTPDPRMKARVFAAAYAAGVSPSTWFRDILLDAAGVTDTARRPGRRRPNRRFRKGSGGNLVLKSDVSATEKARIEKEAARNGQTVSEFAADAITAALEAENKNSSDKKGQER
jgi:predicted HicB family RNase H-like nuclease